MSHDINSLKQAILALPLEAAEVEPAISFINIIRKLQAHQAKAVLCQISEDAEDSELRRLSAQRALDEIKIARPNRQ